LAANVDYGQIAKVYGTEADERAALQPFRRHLGFRRKSVQWGNPDVDLISTSYVERLNATTRLHMRRLTRLTLAFSKKLRELRRRRSGCTSRITTS
jgi:hypothetical protein